MIIAKLMSAQQLKSFSYQLIKEDEKLTRPMFFFLSLKHLFMLFLLRNKKKTNIAIFTLHLRAQDCPW